jgi:hypothetical protein
MNGRALLAGTCLLALSSLSRAASAGTIESLFIISKSENKNQVHYALTVDDACAPLGPAPVRPYWRMFEKGPNAQEPLLDREQPAYGIASQSVTAGVVTLSLRALSARGITVRTFRGDDGRCQATSHVTIEGAPARLYNVHVALKLLGVDYLLLTGWSDAGRTVREKLSPRF